jgi:SNF2 family DNA or RNA helicase
MLILTGKTLTALAVSSTVMREQPKKKVIVICPKTLIGSWESQFELWLGMSGKVTTNLDFFLAVTANVTLVTNYESLPKVNEKLGTNSFIALVIFDEFHIAKNNQTKDYKNMKEVCNFLK